MTVFNVLIASAVFSLAAALTSTIADLASSFAAFIAGSSFGRLARGDHAVLGHHLGAPLGGTAIGPIAPHGVAGWGLRVGVADRQQRHSLGHGGGRAQGEGERCGT
jgi:hypothetical protein